MLETATSLMNKGMPKKPGLCFVVTSMGGKGFRYFDGDEFLKRSDTPWDASHDKQLGTRPKIVGWLRARKVAFPAKEADLKEAWSSENPQKSGVYAVLSDTPHGLRETGLYRVWTGENWGVAAHSPHEAVLLHLTGSLSTMRPRTITWRPLTKREAAILASIELPVAPDEITPTTVRPRGVNTGTINGVLIEVLKRNPGSFPVEIGELMAEILGYEVVYAALLHNLHRMGHVIREPALGRSGPSFRYWAALPDLRAATPVRDTNLLIQSSGPATLTIELDGATYQLTAKEVCELRATLAGVR